jgi:hypothetical protein
VLGGGQEPRQIDLRPFVTFGLTNGAIRSGSPRDLQLAIQIDDFIARGWAKHPVGTDCP